MHRCRERDVCVGAHGRRVYDLSTYCVSREYIYKDLFIIF
jgi:hypothetical protein